MGLLLAIDRTKGKDGGTTASTAGWIIVLALLPIIGMLICVIIIASVVRTLGQRGPTGRSAPSPQGSTGCVVDLRAHHLMSGRRVRLVETDLLSGVECR